MPGLQKKNEAASTAPVASPPGKSRRLLILLAGILVGQAILYGPSLLGRKILLPLDMLAKPRYYIPQAPGIAGMEQHNRQLVDLVTAHEPGRHFLGSEIRAGRFPLWNPYIFAGAPNTLSAFSPFVMLDAAFVSPRILPWTTLLVAVVAGLGAYLFCRRVLLLSFWPAAVAGWCYPLTAFFVFWIGYGVAYPVAWLPWLLLAVHRTVHRGGGLAAVGLAVVTCLVLVSGRPDIAGQVLLSSGLYALWSLADAWRNGHQTRWPPLRAAVLRLLAGWGLGAMLAAPAILPMVEYSRTGARIARRGAGAEERPPVGLAAVPQVVFPKMYGSVELGTIPIFPKGQGNLTESTAAAYTGLLATLFLAPLAWCSRRHLSTNLFLVFLGFIALSWSFNVPGLVSLWRLPGFNMLSYNRFVFAASFAILAMAAIGLEVLLQGRPRWRWWFWLPLVLLAGLCVWRVYRALFLPDFIENDLVAMIRKGTPAESVHDLFGVQRAQQWFSATSAVAALLCALAAAAWLFLRGKTTWRPWFVPALGVFLMADLLTFGFGRPAQCDPALYYPSLPMLEQIKKSVPGRIMGYNCLPANLGIMADLSDIRGYDGVDPSRLIDVLSLGADPQSVVYPYAKAQFLTPRVDVTASGLTRLPPVFDMLSVRYLIFRDPVEPIIPPALREPDYWALVNSNALPRVYVPERVELAPDPTNRLQKLASPDFDPRAVAFVETPVDLPASCRGTAQIVEEIPTRIKVAVRMETPGLVVLADRWDKGWRAYLDGKAVPILPANHAIRGVVVPAGSATIEFRYQPATFAWGLKLAGLAIVFLLSWTGLATWNRKQIP